MDMPLAPLADRFRFNNGLFAMLSEGLDESDWAHRPEGGGNCGHWILGHLAAARRGLRRRLGEDVATQAWEADFERGAAGEIPESAPSPERLSRDLLVSGAKLEGRLREVDAATAETEWEAGFPDGSSTLGAGCHFLYFHETLHLGQLSYLRSTLGKSGIA